MPLGLHKRNKPIWYALQHRAGRKPTPYAEWLCLATGVHGIQLLGDIFDEADILAHVRNERNASAKCAALFVRHQIGVQPIVDPEFFRGHRRYVHDLIECLRVNGGQQGLDFVVELFGDVTKCRHDAQILLKCTVVMVCGGLHVDLFDLSRVTEEKKNGAHLENDDRTRSIRSVLPGNTKYRFYQCIQQIKSTLRFATLVAVKPRIQREFRVEKCRRHGQNQQFTMSANVWSERNNSRKECVAILTRRETLSK